MDIATLALLLIATYGTRFVVDAAVVAVSAYEDKVPVGVNPNELVVT